MKIFNSAYSYKHNGQYVKPTVNKLGYYFDELGERKFGVVGEVDVQAEIDRYKDSCDYTILKSYLFNHYNGTDIPGEYGIRPNVITDVNDVGAMVEELQMLYNSLPNFIKDKYKNIKEVLLSNDRDVKQIFDDIKNNNISNSNNNESDLPKEKGEEKNEV